MNLMPRNLNLASNFFFLRCEIIFLSVLSRGEIFFFNHKMICIRDR